MKPAARLSLLVIFLGICGAALLVFLLARHGWASIAGAVAAAGWGVAAVIAFHLVPMCFDVLGWRCLIPRENRLRFLSLLHLRWIGDSVSAMLPVAQVGGEIVRVRLAAARGMPMPIAAATVVVGITVSVATQIVFTLSGMALLFLVTGRGDLGRSMIVGTLVAVAAVGGFYAVQRIGMFRLMGAVVSHLTQSDAFRGLVQKGEALDRVIRSIYAQRRAIAASSLWNMFVWTTGAVEVWIALRALGVSVTFPQAYILESAAQGIRSAMFLVPGALGVQEGGFLVVGSMLGISADNALALAMIRRARELAFGVPGLLAWQWAEGTHWWRRHSAASVAPAAESIPPAMHDATSRAGD